MMTDMTLDEVVRDLDRADRAATICARAPWSGASEAELLLPDEEGRLPKGWKERGLKYFLEVAIARDILEQYEEVKPRTPEERLDFVIYYAENDAFPDE